MRYYINLNTYKALYLYILCRQIWICGEVMTSTLRDRMGNIAPWVKMFNFYSVSECHDVTCAGK